MMMIRAEAVSVAGDQPLRQRTRDELMPFAGRIAHSSGFAMPVDWGLARLAIRSATYRQPEHISPRLRRWPCVNRSTGGLPEPETRR